MNISKDIKYLDVVDELTSHETFTLYRNEKYDMLVTDAPSEDEISKYYDSPEYISHTDSKKSIIDIAYQLVKEKSLRNKLKHIVRFHPTVGKLLDIGAGTGDFLAKAKSKNWKTFGVEPNEKARQVAHSKGIDLVDNIHYLKENQFDVITMWHVLEHVHDLDGQLNFLKNRLSIDGVIFIAVPNFKSYDSVHYGKYWAAFDVPRHLWHFSQTSISQLLAEKQLKVVATLPMHFDSFYISLLSEKYSSGKVNYWKSFLIGLKSNRLAKKSGEFSSLIYVIKHDNSSS